MFHDIIICIHVKTMKYKRFKVLLSTIHKTNATIICIRIAINNNNNNDNDNDNDSSSAFSQHKRVA